MAYRTDLTGLRFGLLTVLRYAGRGKDRHSRWSCKCECGGEVVVPSNSLKSGLTKSCGCLHGGKTTHGMTVGGRIPDGYRSWIGMRRRCTDPTDQDYAIYGGRGISVCDRWMLSFVDFMSDMGSRPTGTSIDRINNDGNYEPGNCRWSNQKRQCNNKRNNRVLSVNGRSATVTQWSEELGISRYTVYGRLSRGASAEDALSAGER